LIFDYNQRKKFKVAELFLTFIDAVHFPDPSFL